MEFETLSEVLIKADEICVLANGKTKKINYDEFLPELEKLVDKSYFSPALGVSIHEMTIKEKQCGYWVSFNYNEEKTFANMPFTELLIEIKPDFYGFNIIRKYENKYTGRCYYLNLHNNSTMFYNYLIKNFK